MGGASRTARKYLLHHFEETELQPEFPLDFDRQIPEDEKATIFWSSASSPRWGNRRGTNHYCRCPSICARTIPEYRPMPDVEGSTWVHRGLRCTDCST